MSMKYELKFHYVNLTVSPLSLIKLEQALLRTSLVQGWKVFHKAGLAILGHLCKSVLRGTPVYSASHNVVVPKIDTTGISAL